jgi:hypothetical protein
MRKQFTRTLSSIPSCDPATALADTATAFFARVLQCSTAGGETDAMAQLLAIDQALSEDWRSYSPVAKAVCEVCVSYVFVFLSNPSLLLAIGGFFHPSQYNKSVLQYLLRIF